MFEQGQDPQRLPRRPGQRGEGWGEGQLEENLPEGQGQSEAAVRQQEVVL